MEANEIRRTAYADLWQIMRTHKGDQTCELLQAAICIEMHIRDITNTSAESGAMHIKLLEWNKEIPLRNKLAIFAEAAEREAAAENWEQKTRVGLIRKIEATIKRIEKKHGVRVIPDLDYDDTTAPWGITGVYIKKLHAPNAQHQIMGVPIDPCQRLGFDSTANDERDVTETLDWWRRGYVISGKRFSDGKPQYNVRCLDGGAWDRSTWKHTTPDLIEAVDYAREITQVIKRYAA